MPPLKNIKHEKFARAVIEKPTYTEAYKEVYDPSNTRLTHPNSAKDHASRLVAQGSVKNRVVELLNKQGLNLERFNEKMGQLLEGKSEDVQFKSMRLGYELHGVLNKENNEESSKDILIQVNIMTSDGGETTIQL